RHLFGCSMSENQRLPDLADLAPSDGHEIIRVFAGHGLALNDTLVEMLSEHFSHRTERRGCGFTQATRHLAVLVNRPREKNRDTILDLFPGCRGPGEFQLDSLRAALAELPASLEREESRLLAGII